MNQRTAKLIKKHWRMTRGRMTTRIEKVLKARWGAMTPQQRTRERIKMRHELQIAADKWKKGGRGA